MNFLTFKIIVGDDSGAPILKKLIPMWNSIKKLDETYMGPEHYWTFYQLGDFDYTQMTIIKWEVWSAWRVKNPTDFDKAAFVGGTCGFFIFSIENPNSYKQLRQSLEVFLSKRKNPISPILTIGLYDQNKPSVEAQGSIVQDLTSYLEANEGVLRIESDDIFDKEPKELLTGVFQYFIEKLRPDLASNLKINDNFWYLSLNELREILTAEKKGVKIRPRHAKEIESIEEKSSQQEEIITTPAVAPEPIATEILDENIAISPEGEKVPISKEISKEEIIDLLKKGYKLPPWVVIPRHCPKCFNQNQHAIREVEDKSVILMQNPLIYGLKFLCGVCGKDWK